MFKDEKYKYNYPAKEVKLLYEDDDKELKKKDTKNVFVEIPKKRPIWFNDNLAAKVATKN